MSVGIAYLTLAFYVSITPSQKLSFASILAVTDGQKKDDLACRRCIFPTA